MLHLVARIPDEPLEGELIALGPRVAYELAARGIAHRRWDELELELDWDVLHGELAGQLPPHHFDCFAVGEIAHDYWLERVAARIVERERPARWILWR